MTNQNWIIVAVVVVAVLILAYLFWPVGETPTDTQEPATTEEPAEPTN